MLLLVVLTTLVAVFHKPRANADSASDVAPVPTRAAPAESDPTSSESVPQDTPLPPVTAIDALLSDSVASRRKLNDAIKRIGGCTDLSSAVADMRDVGDERQQQIETVRTADLSALSGGESLRSELITALNYALEADQDFLSWAEPTTTSGCANTTGRSQAYGRGRAASSQAHAAKRRFLVQWNPVASDNGLSRRSADDI